MYLLFYLLRAYTLAQEHKGAYLPKAKIEIPGPGSYNIRTEQSELMPAAPSYTIRARCKINSGEP